MSLKNTTTSYGSVSRILHWLLFLLIIGMLIVGFLMGSLAKPFRFEVYTVHKSIGLCVLALMLFRIFWMSINPKPKLPLTTPRWQAIGAHTVQGLLYFILMAMPLSGWIMSTASDHIPSFFGWFKVPMPFIPLDKPLADTASSLHEIFAWTLIVLLLLHIGAALKHHYINKDDVLKRMLRKIN